MAMLESTTVSSNINTYLSNVNTQMTTAQTNLTNALLNFSFSEPGTATQPITQGGIDQYLTLDSTLANGSTLATLKDSLQAISTAISGLSYSAIEGVPTPSVIDTYSDADGWGALKTLLLTFTDNITSADSVDTVVTSLSDETGKLQVALYAADLERKQQALRDGLSAANSKAGARGFSRPNMMTTAERLSITQKYMFDLSQTSRDIVKMIFEWAKSNFQFSVQQRIAAGQADMDFTAKYNDVCIRAYVEKVTAAIQEYKGQLEGALLRLKLAAAPLNELLEVYKTNTAIMSERDKVLLAQYATAVQESVALFEATSRQQDATARTKIEAASAAVRSASEMASAASQIVFATANNPTA